MIGNQALVGSIRAEQRDEIIEVVAVENEAGAGYEIRLLSFGEGIGWYVQKTLAVDSLQAKALAKVLSRADLPIKTTLITDGDVLAQRRVISFPAL
ncbi:MAG: hypothetical protein ACT4NX_02050 [Deltaproteobacteria bacterium]